MQIDKEEAELILEYLDQAFLEYGGPIGAPERRLAQRIVDTFGFNPIHYTDILKEKE